jgi:predicted ATPase
MSIDEFQFQWLNFRSFRDTGLVEIRPVTILIGANNSGKTSLLAPLLLLKQTLEGSDPKIPLNTKGKYLDAGTFEDFVRNHRKSDTVTFNFSFLRFPDHMTAGKMGTDPPGFLSLSFELDKESQFPCLNRYQIVDAVGRVMLTRSLTDSGNYSLTDLQKWADSGGNKTLFDTALRKRIRAARPRHFLFSDLPFTETLVERATKGATTFSPFSRKYLQAVEYTRKRLVDFLSSIKFIGPIRSHPRRVYELSGDMPDSVGTHGEYTAELLYRWSGNAVIKEVETWLCRFGFDVTIETSSFNNDAYSLVLSRKSPRSEVNFADTAFGLSQVLPLIVQGLHSKSRKELIITEQPEIHLNPRLQAVLADLFVDIANAGSKVLIETHSEHLLLRLRRLIAEKQIKARDVALYFVENGRTGSVVRQVEILPNGHIDAEDWPTGFFADSLQDAFGLAKAQIEFSSNA